MTNSFNVDEIRNDFPILHQTVNNNPLVYLDNAATTQKPQAVIDALVNYYQHNNANVHRGAHALADRATRQFEEARTTVRAFINANEDAEIIWTKGTTEGINMVAQCFLPTVAKPGDKVIVTSLEHHANFVPWQQQCLRLGLEFIVIPVTEHGEFDMIAFEAQLDERVAMVAVAHVSNSLGIIHPIKNLIDKAHAVGAKTLIDGAQAVSHIDVDVQALDCDFYVFSGHKLFAPTGIGVLYGRRDHLQKMLPYQLGGEMISDVSIEKTTFSDLPYKFEAGTPNIADVIGLKAAIDYFQQLDKTERQNHEAALMRSLSEKAKAMNDLTPLAVNSNRAGILSFVLDGIHCHDVAMLLDKQGIAVRTGHHCAMPIMKQFNLPAGTLRASIAFYNTMSDIDALFNALEKARSFLR